MERKRPKMLPPSLVHSIDIEGEWPLVARNEKKVLFIVRFT